MVWVGQVYFYVCAAVAILGAVATIVSRNPIRGAMGLLLMIVSIAGLFLALNAQFLAAIQLIVYAGAIVVLFLFVIMLLGPSSMAPRDKRGLVGRAIGGTVFGIAVADALWLTRHVVGMPMRELDASFGSIVAVVGAVAVARGKQGEEAHTPPSGQPGLAGVATSGTSPASGFADVRATRLEGHGHSK